LRGPSARLSLTTGRVSGLGARGARPSRWSRAWVAWARSAPELTENGRWILGRLLDRIEPLDQEIREVEQRLHQATAADAKVAALLAEPGIGPVTAWVLRAFVGRFDRFAHGKQLSRYCGLSPANASSGAVQADAGLVRGCNKLLRAILIQAAHRLIRTVPRWRDLAAAMARRGKKKCLVVAAVANRWMRGLWHRHLETRRPRAARPA
jgi:transposase